MEKEVKKLKKIIGCLAVMVCLLGGMLISSEMRRAETQKDLSKVSQKLELTDKLHKRQTNILTTLNEKYPYTFKDVIAKTPLDE